MILTDNTKQILHDIKYFGGSISLKDHNLKLSFPDDFNNPDLLERIKINKSSLINFLVNESRITPTLKKTEFKATSGQKGVWFLSQFEEGSNAYHITTVFDLTGKVNPNFLEKSFQVLMDRHEILRTTFYVDEEGELYQQIHEKGTLNLDFNCFKEHEFSKQEELLEKYGNTLFDLAKDSLFRCVLIKGNERNYILGLTLHHIISDGWSVGVLIKELLHIYDQLNEGGNVVLPELKIQYKDYACWLTNRVSNMELSQSYWKDKLSGELPMLDLLGFQTRPPVKTYVGNRVLLSIDKLRVERWKKTCKENNATLFMGLLSGLNAILYRYTSQQDFIIGTAITGRIHQDVINQIGFYVNTLPIRAKVTSESSFLDLLSEVRETTLEAFEHQEYPFNAILEDINITRDASRSPLFDCMLVLQNNEKIGIESNGLKVIQRDNISKTSKYDLSFDFTENNDGELNLRLEYNTDIFQQDFVKRLGTHYVNMMNTMVVNENLPICSLEYLSEQEKHQLLFEFNDTKVDCPKDKTIIDLFEEQVEKYPKNIALKDDIEFYSYLELDRLSNQIAEYFIINYGNADKSPVAVLLKRSVNLIAILLGILKSGRSYIPLDPTFPKERLNYIFQNSQSKILISEKEYGLDNIEDIKIDTLENILLNIDKLSGTVSQTISPQDTVYIIYTSGSTGNPKGVEIGHQSLLNFLTSIQSKPGINPKDIMFSVTTYSFDISMLEFFLPLITGATLYLANQEIISDPTLIIEKLLEVKPTILQATPSFYQMLFNANWQGNKELKVLCGGDLLSEALAKKLINHGSEVWNMYGPTETTIWSSTKQIEQPSDASNIGKPINNTQFYILDEFLKPKLIGATGAIYIAGDGLAKGYYKNETLTKERFIKNPFSTESLLYETGDIGKWNENGEIEFLGRNDNQVKIRGYRIELGEIENAILQFSNALKQAVVLVKENNSDKVLVAYYISKSKIDKSEIRSYLQNKLPEYMVPSFYVEIESFPLTPNGKVDRKSLPSVTGEDIIKKEYVGPRNKEEEKLVAIWQEVLRIEKIGITDNFFELGGNSLNVNQIISKIFREFSVKISFDEFFNKSNIKLIANVIVEYNNTTKWVEKGDLIGEDEEFKEILI